MVTETKGALRPAEAAAWLSCSRQTVDRLLESGTLRGFYVGRSRFISVDELKRFIAEREAESN